MEAVVSYSSHETDDIQPTLAHQLQLTLLASSLDGDDDDVGAPPVPVSTDPCDSLSLVLAIATRALAFNILMGNVGSGLRQGKG